MIVEWFLGVIASVVHAVVGWIPVVPVPGWFTSATDGLSTVFAFASSMGAWFPLTIGTTVLSAVFASVVIGFGVKVVRIVLSFFTAGGGSAG